MPNPFQFGAALQAQDGSFVGTYMDNSGQTDMIAFDSSGNVRWTVPNETPQIATDDGGVIGQSGAVYDPSGNAVGQIPNATQSWFGRTYKIGSVERIFEPVIAHTLWAMTGGNASGNGPAPSTSPELLSALTIPNLRGVVEGQSYMPAAIAEAKRVLSMYQACTQVYGTPDSRKGSFSPALVLSAVFGNIGLVLRSPCRCRARSRGNPSDRCSSGPRYFRQMV